MVGGVRSLRRICPDPAEISRKGSCLLSASYPGREVPSLYRDIARYPATFLIDRKGELELAPDPEQPFDKLVSAVDSLLAKK